VLPKRCLQLNAGPLCGSAASNVKQVVKKWLL
jgi:hypothetical protein